MKKYIAIIIAITMIILTCEKVKASEITSWTTAQTRVTTNFNGSESTTSWQTGTYTYTLTNPITRIEYRFAYSGGLSNQNTYTFNLGYVPNPDSIYPVGITLNAGSVTTLDYTCSTFTRDSVPTYKVTCTFTPNSSLSSSQYIYAIIDFYEGYLSTIRGSYTGFEERKGTNAVITEQTNNIINAGQENTTTIINGINEALQNACPNLINFNNGNTQSVTAQNDDYFVITYDGLYLTTGKTYYIKWKSNKSAGTSGDTAELHLLQNWGYDHTVDIDTKSKTFTVNSSGNYYLRLDCNKSGSTCTFYDLIISEENVPYCKYGTYTSKIDETNKILNEDHEYNNNASQNINGQQDLDNLDTQDEQIRDNMDFSAIENNNITIDTNANSFIWGIIERLRSMNEYIVLLMTSIMGIGLIKLVLGR